MSVIKKTIQSINYKLEKLTQFETGWENRSYDFYLLFGQNGESKSPWLKSNWESDFQPFFDKLVEQTGNVKQTGIRVRKYKPEKRISKKDDKEFIYHSEIKLGRLKWDNKSHEKWTLSRNIENYFQNFELWTPIWTVCEKQDSPPDLFISLTNENENDYENRRNIKFGYFIVIAIAKNLKIDSKPIIKELSEKINSKATILKTRKWGKSEKVGNWTFNNWIQDTFSNGIYKAQNLHIFNFDELEFEPEFEVIYKQK